MKKVVAEMCVTNLVVKKVENAIVSVNSCERSSYPGPSVIVIEGDAWIFVVEEGVSECPKETPQDGKTIPQKNCQETIFTDQSHQQSNSGNESGC